MNLTVIRPEASLPGGASPSAAKDFGTAGDGQPLLLVSLLGVAADLTSLIVQFQESDDASAWTNLGGQLTHPSGTEPDYVKRAYVTRTKRYVRWTLISLNVEADCICGAYAVKDPTA